MCVASLTIVVETNVTAYRGILTFNEPDLILYAVEGLGFACVLEHEAAAQVARGSPVRMLEDRA